MPGKHSSCRALDDHISTLCGHSSWAFTGASALLFFEGRFWLEIGKHKHWQMIGGRQTAPLGAIGGSIEPGESLLQTLDREALEEIGCSLNVTSTTITCSVYEHSRLTVIKHGPTQVATPALLTVSRNLYRQTELEAKVLVIGTYIAHALATPAVRDLLGLLAVPPGALRSILIPESSPLCLNDVLSLPGVELQSNALLPPDLCLKPVWTMESLQVVLARGVQGLLAH